MTAERLQKVIAAAGIASRRHAEALIIAGHVTVNGRVVGELGTKADPAVDDVRVDGNRLAAPSGHTYLAMHKPPGVLTAASDGRGRRTVVDLLPPGTPHVEPVGRLDLDSEGLLILTNDGEVALRLSHPRFATEKEYFVVAEAPVPPATLAALREGVEIEGRTTAPATVVLQPPARGFPPERTYRVVIHEGRNRQIRRMFATQAIRVERLVRTRVGPVRLGDLHPGDVRPLSVRELVALGLPAHG